MLCSSEATSSNIEPQTVFAIPAQPTLLSLRFFPGVQRLLRPDVPSCLDRLLQVPASTASFQSGHGLRVFHPGPPTNTLAGLPNGKCCSFLQHDRSQLALVTTSSRNPMLSHRSTTVTIIAIHGDTLIHGKPRTRSCNRGCCRNTTVACGVGPSTNLDES
jgi:hypothetical protein